MSSQVPLGRPSSYQEFANILTSTLAGTTPPTNPKPKPEGPVATSVRKEMAREHEKMLKVAERGTFNFTTMIAYKANRGVVRVLDAHAAGQWPNLEDASSSFDTPSFDYIGYLNNADLDRAAHDMGLKPGDFVMDVGSGEGHTMRYLHRKFGVDVVGVEKRQNVHALAEDLNAAAKLGKPHVRAVWMDFLELPEDRRKFDSMISLLTMVHYPDRSAVFRKAATLLRMGGTLHIQDYYAKKKVADAWTRALIKCVVHCPGIPTREQLMQELKAAGFKHIRFEDVSDSWQFITWRRARLHRGQTAKDDVTREAIAGFYDGVTTLFSRGDLGGFRITARLVKNVFGAQDKIKDNSGTASIAASEKKAQAKDDTTKARDHATTRDDTKPDLTPSGKGESPAGYQSLLVKYLSAAATAAPPVEASGSQLAATESGPAPAFTQDAKDVAERMTRLMGRLKQ